MKLCKNGLVRETWSQPEAERLLAMGYQEMAETVEMAGRQARQVMLENLLGLKAEELRALCEERGMSLPSAAKKQELAAAIADYEITHGELTEDKEE